MNEQYIKIDTKGSKFYYEDREMTILHIDKDGHKVYYKDREMEIFHREDGPAVVWPDETKQWYLDGKRHREDGPAIEYSDGSKEWFLNGKLHREDGPAVEWVNGTKVWCINGEFLTQEEHAKQTAKEVIVSIDDIAKMLNIPVEKLKIKK